MAVSLKNTNWNHQETGLRRSTGQWANMSLSLDRYGRNWWRLGSMRRYLDLESDMLSSHSHKQWYGRMPWHISTSHSICHPVFSCCPKSPLWWPTIESAFHCTSPHLLCHPLLFLLPETVRRRGMSFVHSYILSTCQVPDAQVLSKPWLNNWVNK